MAAAGLGLGVGGERRGRSERWIKERGPGLIGEELMAWPAPPVFVSDGGSQPLAYVENGIDMGDHKLQWHIS